MPSRYPPRRRHPIQQQFVGDRVGSQIAERIGGPRDGMYICCQRAVTGGERSGIAIVDVRLDIDGITRAEEPGVESLVHAGQPDLPVETGAHFLRQFGNGSSCRRALAIAVGVDEAAYRSFKPLVVNEPVKPSPLL